MICYQAIVTVVRYFFFLFEVVLCCFIESITHIIQISAVVAYTVLGLIYLHREGIIHRDMKAGNILITDEGFVKIGKQSFAASCGLNAC